MMYALVFVLAGLGGGSSEYGQIERIATAGECEKVKTFLAGTLPRWRGGQCIEKVRGA